MIWFWLVKFLSSLKRLFSRPSARDVAKIDPHAPCPVCGARSGKIRCVLVVQERNVQRNEIMIDAKGIYARHECAVCGAQWFEQPVVKVGTQSVLPAVGESLVRAA